MGLGVSGQSHKQQRVARTAAAPVVRVRPPSADQNVSTFGYARAMMEAPDSAGSIDLPLTEAVDLLASETVAFC
jgi:hypothetical protein